MDADRSKRLARLTDLAKKIHHDRSVRSALFAFILTRAIVFAIFILGTSTRVVESNRPFAVDPQDVQISLSDRNVLDGIRSLALRGDGAWYWHVADRGYERIAFNAASPHNWTFFPFFPLCWRLAAKITGGFPLTGIALSNVFFFFALLVLHRTVLAFSADEGVAERAVFYTAAYPLSYFFSLPLSESLFLLVSAGSFYAAKRDYWWTAGILGALASATRFAGVLLLPALLILQWQKDASLKPRLKTLSILMIPLGLIAFMVYLHFITGNALAFSDIMTAWGRQPGFFLQPILEYLRHPLDLSFKWDFYLLNFVAVLLAFTCGLVLLKRREWALAVYTLASVIVPLSTSNLQSLARYMVVVFPIFIVLARAGQTKLFDQSVRTIFVASLALMTALCVFMVTLAMS
jgi:Mannosyltransferase (PIG-V)